MPGVVAVPDPDCVEAAGVVERLSAAIRVMNLYRQLNPALNGKPLQLLLRRLVRVRSAFQKVISADKGKK